MVPLPTLRQLRYLTALAKHCHFGKAAEECLATQSTVSAGLAELEAVLGVSLAERSRRQVLMTPIGQQLAEHAQILLDGARNLVELAQASRRSPLNGPLRLGVIPTIAPYILPQLLPRLRRDYPHLQLYLREDLSANLLKRLHIGDLDILLLALPYDMDHVTKLEVGHDPFVLVCPPGHPLAAKQTVTANDLRQAGWVMLEEGHCLRDHSLAACALSSADVGQPVLATSLTTLVQMVANGLGVALLPQMAVNGGILSGTPLEVRPLAPPATSRQLALVWRDTSLRQAEFSLLVPYFAHD